MSQASAVEQSVLVDVEPPSAGPVGPKAPVDKTFRVYDQDQPMLLPPDLRNWLPAGHPARMVDDLVEHGGSSNLRGKRHDLELIAAWA